MSHAYGHIVSEVFRSAEKMPPPKGGKNPLLAFILGFMFGPFGVGLYLRSVTDFLLTLGLLILGSLMTAGLAAPVFWLLCGAWAAVRVNRANKRIGPGVAGANE